VLQVQNSYKIFIAIKLVLLSLLQFGFRWACRSLN